MVCVISEHGTNDWYESTKYWTPKQCKTVDYYPQTLDDTKDLMQCQKECVDRKQQCSGIEWAGEVGCIIKDCLSFENDMEDFDGGARIFLKEVPDPERFGVATVRKGTTCDVISIEEKPKKPKSNLCVTGLYVYDNKVFNYIKNLTPSDRGELEITDVNNFYVKDRLMSCHFLDSWWSDAGTFESLLKASSLVANKKLCTCDDKKQKPLPMVGAQGEFGKTIVSEK